MDYYELWSTVHPALVTMGFSWLILLWEALAFENYSGVKNQTLKP
jgi:hypothetical protein